MSNLHDWLQYVKELNLEQLQYTLKSYSQYGPLPGFLLVLLESFLPFFPLMLIIAANANIYGLGIGFLLSWAGVTTGAVCLFWICRKLGGRVKAWAQRRYPKTERFFNWIERKGFTPLFLLACFPFSPSFVITVLAGLSKVPFSTFIIATALGKAVMIFSISLLSFDIASFGHAPWRIVVTVVVVLALWFGGKQLESRYQVN